MKKRRIGLIAFLVVVFTLCAGAMIACGGDNTDKAKNYTLTWDVNTNVTVTMEGYTTLPTTVKDGTELKFTLTPATGWMVTTVTPANVIRQQADGSYTMTVNKDLSIKINAREVLESINVTQNKTLYAGNAVKEGDIIVTAHYKSNRDEEIPFGNYSIDYGKVKNDKGEDVDATSVSLGQESIKISYNDEAEATLTFDNPIKALIKVDLYGGTITAAQLDEFKGYDAYKYDDKEGVITWEIAEATESDIILPVPTKEVRGFDFPFKAWSGTEDDGVTIAAGLNTSKTFTAVYDPKLVDIQSLAFSLEKDGDQDVPYLTIRGEFIAAESAYLYLYEGNDKVELKGDVVEQKGESVEFVLKYDLRKLAVATVEDEENPNYGNDFLGKWMDIKFRAEIAGGKTETQEIDLTKYDEDFVDLEDSVRGKADGDWYNFAYKVYTPDKSDSKLLKLICTNARPWNISAQLTVKDRDVPGEGDTTVKVPTAYLKLTGVVDEVAQYTTDELKAAVENTYLDVQAFGEWNWAKPSISPEVTVVDARNFYIEIGLQNTSSADYFMHYTDSSTNLSATACPVTAGSVQAGAWTYTLSDNSSASDWTSGLVHISVRFAVTISGNRYAITLNDDKVYMSMDGTYTGTMTAAEIKETISIDFELDGDTSNITVIDASKITVTLGEEAGTFTVTAEIPDLAYGRYWTHAIAGSSKDVYPTDESNVENANGKVFKFVSENRGTWWANLMEVTVATPVKVSAVKLQTEGADDAAKLYYVIEYSLLEGYTKANSDDYAAMMKVNLDLQDRGGSWVKHQFTGTVTANEDGSITVKIDISGLAEFTESISNFTTHYELLPIEKDAPGDFKPDIESFQHEAVTFNGKNYVIRFVKGDSNDYNFWGYVGIDVTTAE